MPTEKEESLAKTLLDRLNIPESPVFHDLYENGEDVMVIPARVAEATSEKSEDHGEAGEGNGCNWGGISLQSWDDCEDQTSGLMMPGIP